MVRGLAFVGLVFLGAAVGPLSACSNGTSDDDNAPQAGAMTGGGTGGNGAAGGAGSGRAGGASPMGGRPSTGGAGGTSGASGAGGAGTAGAPSGGRAGGSGGSGASAGSGGRSAGAGGQPVDCPNTGAAGADDASAPSGDVTWCSGDCPSGECDGSFVRCEAYYPCPFGPSTEFCAQTNTNYCLGLIGATSVSYLIVTCRDGTPTFEECQAGCGTSDALGSACN